MKRLPVIVCLCLLFTSVFSVAYAQSGVSLTVQVSGLNVRQGPGTDYPVISSLNAGDTVTALGKDSAGDWYQVQTAAGGTGWVNAAYVQPAGDTGGLPVVAAPAVPAATPDTVPATGSVGPGVIVFQVSNGGPIYVVNPDGSGLRYLTTGIGPAISPDGKHVAFTRWSGGQNGDLGNVWIINIDGSNEHNVFDYIAQPIAPTWSPDGTKLAIQKQQGGTLSIHSAPARRALPDRPR